MAPILLWVTDHKVLGANYGAMLVLPLAITATFPIPSIPLT